MKTSHIIAIIFIAIAITMMVSTFGDASEYVTFAQAREKAQKGESQIIHVVGTLKKGTGGKVVGLEYDAVKNPNYFAFELKDTEQQTVKVVYFNPKPADFERSEQVVVKGRFQGNQFIAKEILLKCPSKYQENKLETKSAGSTQK
jgi:cytochrome c-type biogenesis protein CcmE